jgi:hypothetical protein
VDERGRPGRVRGDRIGGGLVRGQSEPGGAAPLKRRTLRPGQRLAFLKALKRADVSHRELAERPDKHRTKETEA